MRTRNINLKTYRNGCLNPYYTGSYSMSKLEQKNVVSLQCLNPYYTGSYSMRLEKSGESDIYRVVLILIILEVTL